MIMRSWIPLPTSPKDIKEANKHAIHQDREASNGETILDPTMPPFPKTAHSQAYINFQFTWS